MDDVRARAFHRLVAAIAAGGGDVPWHHVPAAAVRRHLLAPLASTLPGGGAFRRDHLASSIFAELRADVLRQTVALLHAEGIPVVLLKGIAYTTPGGIYADAALRPMTDLDLMVPGARHTDTVALLQARGYVHTGAARQRSPLHHAMTLKRAGVALDIHRNIVQALRSRVDLEALWSRAVPIAGIPGAHRLEPIDELLFHLLHMARHELIVAAVSYLDALRLRARLTAADLAAFEARAREFRIARAIDHTLAAVDDLTSSRRPRRSLAIPTIREIAGNRPPWRPVQIVRKIAMSEGPLEAGGLMAVGVTGLAFRMTRFTRR